MKLSLVVPCYNEEGNVKKLFDSVNIAFENKIQEYEFIFVNDGSKDNTRNKLKELLNESSDANSIYLKAIDLLKENAVLK